MRQKEKLWKLFLGIILAILSLILLNIFIQEVIAKCIIGFVVIAAIVIAIAKGLEINGMSDIFAVILLEAAPVLIHFFSDIPFIYKITKIYMGIAQFFCSMIGKDIVVNISKEMSVTITIVLIFCGYEVWNYNKDRTAMKVLRKSRDEDLKEKNFAEKSEMFCKTLHQWLEEINRETNWNEEQFTPLEAEVEMDNGRKRKKKYEDLIKCLKNNRRYGTVYLVLGSPGSGKSVSMRKLCLDLLKESKKTKKIPVYINLKEWNEEWNVDHMPEKRDLIVFIRKTFEAKADFSTESFLNEYFYKMLDDGRWYFVFDSFDEMPCLMGKKNCQELIDGISALLHQFMTGPNQSGGVVASRLYKAPSSAVGATVTLKIQEFSDIKIKTMLKKCLNHYDEVIKLLFDGREDLVALCRNPFYLALLINYISDRGLLLPENQMELYQSFINGRLRKCAGKMEKEGLDENEIYMAAKKMASFMQETEECGLECPTRFLYQQGEEVFWRKVFTLLKYAKICRLGGQDETISFVHRRFQEFFLVENIIDQKLVIRYENYHDILSDAGMRDALVLYCEVAEEKKAKEIANFCWQTIQANIKFANNIHTKESQELICVLYFMKEAFRNRTQILSNFIDDFYQLVKKIFDKNTANENNDSDDIHTDYIIMLALVNTMILFSKTQLENLVLMVFQLNNRWLNDVIVQNCRMLDALGYHIENEIVRYFGRMDLKNFLRRFPDMHFSLSVSEKFRYIRKMHVMIMVIDILCVFMVISIGVPVTVNLLVNLLYRGIPEINSLQNISVSWSIVEHALALALISLTVFFIVLLPFSAYMTKFFSFQDKVFLFIFLYMLFSSDNILLLTIGLAEITIFATVIITIMILFYIRAFKFYSQKRKLVKKMLKNLMIKYSSDILALVVIYVVMFLTILYKKIFVIIMLVSMIGAVILICSGLGLFAHYVVHSLKDYMWFRKHFAETKRMQRTQLESNLISIYSDRMKYKYLEQLLLYNTELVGTWSNDIRPQYSDDRVNHALAKLDCIRLDSCDYLF